MWIRADGGAEPLPLTRDDTHRGQTPASVSPDGRFVLITRQGMGAQSLTIDTSDPDHPKAGATEPLLNTSAIVGGTISPDGRWLAYTFVASGTVQVFVRPFANGKIAGSGAWQISAAGGAYPVWSRAARQLLYATSEGRIMVVDYTVEGDSFDDLKAAAVDRQTDSDDHGGYTLRFRPSFRPDTGRQAHHCMGAGRPAEGSQGGSARNHAAELV